MWAIVCSADEVLALLASRDTLKPPSRRKPKRSLAEAMASAQGSQSAGRPCAGHLQQQGFISAAQLSQALSAEASSASARVQSARALVQLQAVRLSQTEVQAHRMRVSFLRGNATVGSVVGAGTELFRLIRQGRLEWRAEVTAADVGPHPSWVHLCK